MGMKRRKTSVRERGKTSAVEEIQACKGWSPQLERMLRTIQDDDYQTRVIQTYLKTTDFNRTAVEMPMMLANLHLAAMDGFLASSGYEVAGATYPPEELRSPSIVPAKTRLLEVSAGRHQSVMEYALLFLNDPQGRPTILSIETNKMCGQVEFTLRADTRWPTDFFTRWRGYAIEHAYLRGQRFYARGQLIRYESPTQLCDVRLSEQTRSKIDRTILAFPRQAKRFKQRGLPAKRGVLLEGPPGTGKTMLCRALCHEIDATFIWVTSRQVEDDAGAIAAVWQLARWLQPAVVLLEDVDLYSLSREQTLRPHIVGELMNQMDGVESSDGILTLATTNRVDVIETALCDRPGRFDRLFARDLRNTTLSKRHFSYARQGFRSVRRI